MAKVLLAGESWISTTVEYKGFDSFSSTKLGIGCEEFLAALRHEGHEVTHLRAHDVPAHFPWTIEELNQYDVVILSDIGSNSLLLPVQVFAEGRPVVNRLDLLAQWVHEGHGLLMAGGYLSFGGFEGKAHYHGTAVERALPVEISPYDDRVEAPQGVCAEVVADASGHSIVRGLDALSTSSDSKIPSLLGYQCLTAKPDAQVLMVAGGDPMLTIGDYGSGRSAAFASDISPHWAPEEFMHWPGYRQLFGNLVSWLAGEEQ